MNETVRDYARKHLPAVVYDALMGAKHRGNCEPHISQFLDAHIYGSGTDIYWSGTDSISVVATEVREKAARAIMLGGWTWEEADEASRESCRKAVDAVLEVVLGQVRVAKEVTSPVLDGVLGYTTTLGLEATRILERGDTIAILERLMSETVEKRTVAQLIARGDMLPGETFVTHGNSIVLAMSEAGILDAHIYGVCQTCGGTGRLYYPDEGRSLICPDCKTLSVVTTEVREKAVDAAMDVVGDCGDEPEYGLTTADWYSVVDAVLEAVLAGIEVVDEVVEAGDGGIVYGAIVEQDVLLNPGDILYIKRKED